MKMNQLVSVIIPVYNGEKYIERCLRSILNQTLNKKMYKVIVINDGSKDSTGKILEKFYADIELIESKKNNGLPSALNKGIIASKTKYIVRLDSDDYVNSEFLNFLTVYASENNFDAVACDYLEVSENEEVLSRKNCEKDPIGCGIIFKYDHLINLGLYDKNFLINEERELMIRFKKKYKVERLKVPLYRYRQVNNSLSDSDKKNEFDKMLDNL